MDGIEDEPLITEESIQEPEETTIIIPEDEIPNSAITPEFENKTLVETVEQKPQDEILLTSGVIPSLKQSNQ